MIQFCSFTRRGQSSYHWLYIEQTNGHGGFTLGSYASTVFITVMFKDAVILFFFLVSSTQSFKHTLWRKTVYDASDEAFCADWTANTNFRSIKIIQWCYSVGSLDSCKSVCDAHRGLSEPGVKMSTLRCFPHSWTVPSGVQRFYTPFKFNLVFTSNVIKLLLS